MHRLTCSFRLLLLRWCHHNWHPQVADQSHHAKTLYFNTSSTIQELTKKPCWSGNAAKHLVWYFKGDTTLLNSVCHITRAAITLVRPEVIFTMNGYPIMNGPFTEKIQNSCYRDLQTKLTLAYQNMHQNKLYNLMKWWLNMWNSGEVKEI